MGKKCCGPEWVNWLIAEIAFFAFLFYAQFLLGVEANLWLSSVILWALMNVSIMACPITHKCYK